MAFDIAAAYQRYLATPPSPSRRGNKHRSGRAGRRQARGQMNLQAVGGTLNPVRAVYHEGPLCVVVPMETGWLPDGSPRREPRWGSK